MSDNKNISDQHIARLSKFISEHLGLYFPGKRLDDLRNKFYLAAMKFGFSNPDACVEWLLSSQLTQEQIEILSSHLTVGETHFYRDKPIYDSLEKFILPEIINARKKQGRYIRIWSAGCSSGEEPYSVAILLHKMLPDITDWNISIIATDINQKALESARKGIYRKWSFRTTPEWMKDGYFIKNKEDSYTITPSIKNMVSFSYHNLAKDPFPSLINNTTAMDIIFCRNVIMYFHPKLAHRIIHLFHRSLIDGGWLIVSGSEGYMVHRSRFVTVSFPDAIFFRKDLSKSGEIETTGTTKTDFTAELDTTLPIPGSTPTAATGKKESGIRQIRSPALHTSSETDAVRQASVLYSQGNYQDAESILTEYLSSDKENPEAVSLLAKIFSNRGQFDKATELCLKGIEADKCNPAFYYLLGLIYREQGKTDEAISSLHSSIYLDSAHVLSHYLLGSILFQQGDVKRAGKYFNNALSLLNCFDKDSILPGSDGISAGRLIEIMEMKSHSDKNRYQTERTGWGN